MNICFECLHKQKPWVSKDMVIRYVGLSRCDECGEDKQLVYVYTDNDEKLLVKQLGFDIRFNSYWLIHFTSQPTVEPDLNKVEITLKDLVINLGWDKVRDRYMYIEGQEDGKPLAFKTNEEYEPYLNYRVVNLKDSIIIKKQTIVEKEIGV